MPEQEVIKLFPVTFHNFSSAWRNSETKSDKLKEMLEVGGF